MIMTQPLLEKYECMGEECTGSFLVNKDRANEEELICPFCGSFAEATVHENPDAKERGVVYGCLYPD
jgi:hypothetical protein